jgi:hypothetical protein
LAAYLAASSAQDPVGTGAPPLLELLLELLGVVPPDELLDDTTALLELLRELLDDAAALLELLLLLGPLSPEGVKLPLISNFIILPNAVLATAVVPDTRAVSVCTR